MARRSNTPHEDLERLLRVRPGSKIALSRFDCADTNGYPDRETAEAELVELKEEMADLQERLWADHRHAVLVVFQAMDAGGKDGCIRQVMSGLNPQGCAVTSFKSPTRQELDHDFLWRIHREVPGRGEIGIFNRSHYEDVLIVRVHHLVPPAVWKARYEQINQFEKLLADTGTEVVKFCLQISKREQEERLLKRLLNPHKNWKFLQADLAERARWGDYMRAYDEVLERCSTDWAPWYLIPADRKWYRDLAVARILVGRLRALRPSWPEAAPETRLLAREARRTGQLPVVGPPRARSSRR